MRFTIPGAPQGKARPKIVRRGNFTQAFTPEKTVNYEALVKLSYQQAAGGLFLGAGVPVRVRIDAYYDTPKSGSKKKLRDMLMGLIFPTKKPDWDNIGKIVCDALNGVAYEDDTQIVDVHLIKQYDNAPRVEVTIIPALSLNQLAKAKQKTEDAQCRMVL